MSIVEALSASGVVPVVGAGGKKTTMYALADRLDRAVVTATVRIPIFDERVAHLAVTDDPAGAVESTDAWPIGVVPEREREDRYLGYDPETIDGLGDRVSSEVDAILVKADGARMRLFKAPDEREPQLPRSADTVIPVASARVVGEPLDGERVHRPERVAALTGLEPGEEITAEAVATVLASDAGGRKDVPAGATVVPLVNMVDDDRLERVGREIARGVLERAPVPRVVLARMIDDEPLVDVIS